MLSFINMEAQLKDNIQHFNITYERSAHGCAVQTTQHFPSWLYMGFS